MSRLTKWDEVRQCYVIDPDSTQNHIQRLGELEDRDEAKEIVLDGGYHCPSCNKDLLLTYMCEVGFCENCGQRLKWGD